VSQLTTYAALERVGPIVTTGEAAVAIGMSLSSTSRLLARLESEGQVHRLRRGLWTIGPRRPDPFVVVSDLTRPHPAYVSFLSALNHHGIVDQLPRDIEVASLDRARSIEAGGATYAIHHLPPLLFTGWEETARGPVATAEKAIFDIFYVAAAHAGRPRRIPELELPDDFDWSRCDRWVRRISSARLRTLTSRGLGSARKRALR